MNRSAQLTWEVNVVVFHFKTLSMNSVFRIVVVFFLVTLSCFDISAQGVSKTVVLNWQGAKTVQGIHNESITVLAAEGLTNDPQRNYTPEFLTKFALPANIGKCDILVTHTEWEQLSPDHISSLTFPLLPDETLAQEVEYGVERGVKMAMLSLVPVVKNPEGGIMRLKSFTIDLVYIPATAAAASLKSSLYAAHSVLAQGNWYKIQLNKTGIYKLSYSDIQAMGVDMATVKPENIRLFGNGGGPLSETNNLSRYDDLIENAIYVKTASPNVFAQGDYILFYGTAPDKITYNAPIHKFEHTLNIYSDYTYYFLNFDGGSGLRIEDQEQSSQAPSYTCTNFTEAIFYEKDLINLIKSGKDWVGERMESSLPLVEIPEYTFPNLSIGKQSWIRYRLAARAPTKTDFTVTINGIEIAKPSCSNYSQYIYGTENIGIKSFFPETEKVKISFRYNGTGSDLGWLDWFELNVPRDLVFTGGQMAFADPFSVSAGRVTKFQLQASSPAVTIWEVTDPLHPTRVVTNIQDNVTTFVLQTDSIRQFLSWDNTSFLSATFKEKVINQDLHAIASADLLIVTHKDYLEQANRLAEHHRSFDGMKVEVVINEQVYNEFSSGAPDIVAIRDIAGMLYHRPESNDKLKYLLLFGDGSYDLKERYPVNTNRVLTFQSKESLSTVTSFACDDFYGEMDDGEGLDAEGLIDIGIGRFPVTTVEQAKNAVDKCISYAKNSEETLGEWRNKICLATDDGNGNTHFSQAEQVLAPLIQDLGPVYNVTKIYMDAFMQISTPIGERCPDANTAINTAVENGLLVMNYTGHGGEIGWADESILTVPEIQAWTNFGELPVFITATCEFSRYDDPQRVSAGEYVFLNPLGGGIALFTTTRLANSGTNIDLNTYFYESLLTKNNGVYPRFGDVISYAKNQFSGGSAEYIRNFLLLGDPALKLAYPKYEVITTGINGKDLSSGTDTISAMSHVEIKGIVADNSGNKLDNFTGIIDVKVFDKARTLITLGSDPYDWPANYTVQDNLIYQGRATVTNGDFTVTFIVPRDIDYSYGPGKISYYAQNGTTDATGYCNQLIIGGAVSGSVDNVGPEIALFLNTTDFINGGITGDTPLLIAQLSDESGISTISNAIGHDIVATLDGDNSSALVLNSYYNADIDSYTSGVVEYKFSQLTEGEHSLTLKAWDVFNNSSEATIAFIVNRNMQITITGMKVYPNPFWDGVKVEFDVNLFDSPVEAHLEVFNINGALVRSTETELLLSEGYNAGTLTWDGLGYSGNRVPPGSYLICVKAGNGKSQTVKAMRVIKVR
jgi:hypothetical protein